MANIKSAKKRAKQNIEHHLRNAARKTSIKTAIKKVLTALESGDIAASKELFKDAEAKLSRAKSKDVIHANTAARKTSRLAKKIAAAQKK